MPIELLIPIAIFVGGILVSHTLTNLGVRILEQQKKR